VFNGSRFRSEIAPRISDFILSMSEQRPASLNGTGKRRAGNGAALHAV
jgi:hypothetical protein